MGAVSFMNLKSIEIEGPRVTFVAYPVIMHCSSVWKGPPYTRSVESNPNRANAKSGQEPLGSETGALALPLVSRSSSHKSIC